MSFNFLADVIHADELGYIWKQKRCTYSYGNDTAAIASRRLVRMLTNFVKEGYKQFLWPCLFLNWQEL